MTNITVTDEVKINHEGVTFRGRITAVYADCSVDVQVLDMPVKDEEGVPKAKKRARAIQAPPDDERLTLQMVNHCSYKGDISEIPVWFCRNPKETVTVSGDLLTIVYF